MCGLDGQHKNALAKQKTLPQKQTSDLEQDGSGVNDEKESKAGNRRPDRGPPDEEQVVVVQKRRGCCGLVSVNNAYYQMYKDKKKVYIPVVSVFAFGEGKGHGESSHVGKW